MHQHEMQQIMIHPSAPNRKVHPSDTGSKSSTSSDDEDETIEARIQELQKKIRALKKKQNKGLSNDFSILSEDKNPPKNAIPPPPPPVVEETRAAKKVPTKGIATETIIPIPPPGPGPPSTTN